MNTLKLELLRGERETRGDIKTNLNEVKALVQVAKERRATMEKTAIKGLDFEAAIVATLINLGHGAGDSVEPTGSSIGSMPRCKTGDAVITLAAATTRGYAIKIAVEAKDTHGNNLRALVKHLDGISDEAIAGLNIPTGIPLVYELDATFRPTVPAATTSTRTPQRLLLPPPSPTRAAEETQDESARPDTSTRRGRGRAQPKRPEM